MIVFIGFLFLISYLVGSIPFGLVLTRIVKGVDLREIGSKNIGTTNVLRTGSKSLALATLILDMGKGGLVVLFSFGGFLPISESVANLSLHATFITSLNTMALVIGFGAILGHCFPIWLKFKGGKGVATTFGALLAAVPFTGLIALATWLAVAVSTRYSSLSALTACAVAPIATLFIYGTAPAVLCLLITLFVWWRHKDNIKRLLTGEESKIGNKG